MRASLIVLLLLMPVRVLAQPFLEPYQSNTYGPGINSDATGRPFTWRPLPGNGPADRLSPVQPNAFGPGIGMDQYGRPVQPEPYPRSGQNEGPIQSKRQQYEKYFGAIAYSQRSGAVGYSYDYRSGNDAARSALNHCGPNCRIVVWFSNACGALAVGSGHGYGASWADTQGDAENRAMRICSANTTDCGIVQWACTSR
jgi:Domain of unknown function (DUF4189)